MKLYKTISFMALILFAAACNQHVKIDYPITQKGEQTDEYFGNDVADPYRWLENDTSAETGEWVKAQNEVTFSYLATIPFRNALQERLTKIWDYPKFGVPFKKAGNYFYFKNDGMQNQSVLYVQNGLDGDARVLLDPNKLAEDGTSALASLSVSNDGKYLGYCIAKAGSDWNDIYVLEVETGKVLEDHIEWVKFSGISWKGDGFYYSCYDAPALGLALSNKNEFHKVFYHKLGNTRDKDIKVWEDTKNPLRNFYAQVTEDERFLVISESESTSGNRMYVIDLNVKNAKPVQIGSSFDFDYNVVDNVGDDLLVITNEGAPRRQLVKVNLSKPASSDWLTIIPQKEEVLESVNLIGGKIIVQYMKDACHHAYVYNMDGKMLEEVAIPGPGTLGGMSGDKNNSEAFYAFTSYIYPTTIFKYDVNKNTSEVFRKPEIDFKPEDFEIKQVFYRSKDSTSIPMFLVYKKGIRMNGNNPTLLYGYGGFNISLTPNFSISRLPFLQNGGIYVVANIRGGGEYGEEWHKAGTKMQKQNVFDDFIAAAEYLISHSYTSPEKLAINGGSNGGLLVGAVLNQRPELFAAAVPAVGVMDMLRYNKFTIGWAWASDYGTSEDSPEMFNYLKSYSPLHSIKSGTKYPATLVMTADHDDRVVPAHSFKYIAALQEAQAGDAPVLIRIETKAGHGAGKPTSKIIEEAADMWSFVMYNLGMKPKF
ncbi:MAG: prolyl oligopeptidase family serine peptidase [Bacteroidales bacterium]|nr:prolyl oligopeptidase family serine peptidase [Bacteroidales bacterium]